MKCINKNLEPIKELLNDFKEPVLSKILDSFPDDYIPTKEEALAKYSELLGSKVDYKLKVINTLQSDKVRNPSKNFQGFINDLEKQGVPKIQLDLIRDSYKQGDNKEDLISTMLANYSYTVEINTAKEKFEYLDDNPELYKEIYNKYIEQGLSPNEADNKASEEFKITRGKNTQYYSNLTVPGGTNYTENEIATPLITPSIKGHAQFATDQGIGWFRSDDKMLVEDTGEIDEPYYNDEEGWVYDNTKKKHIATKTRRILEVQSDLFQKGRASDLLVNTLNRNRKDNIRILELNNISYDRELTKEEQDELKKLNEPNFNEKGNQFLQLLNKDNNWVKFFVQSIIQDSAKQTVMEAREEDIKAKVRELENSGLLKIKCD